MYNVYTGKTPGLWTRVVVTSWEKTHTRASFIRVYNNMLSLYARVRKYKKIIIINPFSYKISLHTSLRDLQRTIARRRFSRHRQTVVTRDDCAAYRITRDVRPTRLRRRRRRRPSVGPSLSCLWMLFWLAIVRKTYNDVVSVMRVCAYGYDTRWGGGGREHITAIKTSNKQSSYCRGGRATLVE